MPPDRNRDVAHDDFILRKEASIGEKTISTPQIEIMM
jgi:hypothetical protein